MATLSELVTNEDAQAIAEFAVLIGVIAVVAIGALMIVGEGADSIFKSIAKALAQ